MKEGTLVPSRIRILLHKGKKNIPTKKNSILVRNWELDNNFADPQGIFGILSAKLVPTTIQNLET
ncbi:hypothetical protein [Mongoliitalea daihaiensis]|uniref:hypothetical protein n=1 Tax=Mongoliitalea daihaiensis TaxID=2782006 RepID=UPI001F1E548A|nr:hypothetical protein [Mongoliitalea daihaiensis]UJP66069.1 hypothetical protein IPZ59_05450 [Mongoliitalea daihaiensis]